MPLKSKIERKNKYNFSDIKVLIIGDLMLDYYLFGEVNRITPEAPVPVVEIYKKEGRPGGAANVALNVHTLGATPILLSVCGNDDSAGRLDTILKNYDISTDRILVEEGRLTTRKNRIFDEDKLVVRFDEEDTDDLGRETEDRLLQTMEQILRQDKPDMIILQDYNKGVLTKRVIKNVLLLATKNGIPVTVDPKEKNFFEYQGVDLLKPNLREVSEALGHRINPKNMEHLKRAAEELRRKTRFKNLMITLGQHGAFFCNQKNEMGVVHARPIKAADVSGAGDTVISTAALFYFQGTPLRQIASLCNKAAGIVCRKVGVAPVHITEMGTMQPAK